MKSKNHREDKTQGRTEKVMSEQEEMQRSFMKAVTDLMVTGCESVESFHL